MKSKCRSQLCVCAYTPCVSRAELRFDCRITNITSDNIVTLTPSSGMTETIPVRLVIGADGAYSSTRTSLMRLTRIDYSQRYGVGTWA